MDEATKENLVPQNYQTGFTYSDFWAAYEKVLNTGKYISVGKETGETARVERWNNTLRQCIGRFVRKTLSFSFRNVRVIITGSLIILL